MTHVRTLRFALGLVGLSISVCLTFSLWFRTHLPCVVGGSCNFKVAAPLTDFWGMPSLSIFLLLSGLSIANGLRAQGSTADRNGIALAVGGALFGVGEVIAATLIWKVMPTYHILLALTFVGQLATFGSQVPEEASEKPSPSFLFGVAGVLTLLACGWIVSNRLKPFVDPNELRGVAWNELVPANRPLLGGPQADQAIVMFSDLNCGASRDALLALVPVAQRDRRTFFVYRHSTLHANGDSTVEALKAAQLGTGDAFWKHVLTVASQPLKVASPSKGPSAQPRILAEWPDRNSSGIVSEDLKLAFRLKVTMAPLLILVTRTSPPRRIDVGEAVQIISSDIGSGKVVLR